MKVLVCGGRDFTDQRRIFEALDVIHSATPITELIHGDCRGADRLAGEWAKTKGIEPEPCPADWDNLDAPGALIRRNPKTGAFYNAKAGHQRNTRMLETSPDLVIAFPGHEGTANCVEQALSRRFGIAVMSVDG